MSPSTGTRDSVNVVSCLMSPPMTMGLPPGVRTRVVTTFSLVGGSVPMVPEVSVPRLDTVALTSIVIMPSPETHPLTAKMRPAVISRVTPV